MNMMRSNLALGLIAMMVVSGCASQSRPGGLTEREVGGLAGAGIGAGSGAIIGSATGNAAIGTAIGLPIGLVAGALVGEGIREAKAEARQTAREEIMKQQYGEPQPALTAVQQRNVEGKMYNPKNGRTFPDGYMFDPKTGDRLEPMRAAY